VTPRDPWLMRWMPRVLERAAGLPVLEIGCGGGEDSETLAGHGLDLVAFDLSAQAVAAAQARVPAARFLCRDVREPFPVNAAGVVVASLSLHYFPWAETEALVARVRETLLPGGMLLCRLNSTLDHHFGASGHAAIAENYYLVDGAPKRFFDRAAVDRLFAQGWRMLGVEEQVSHKYDRPKALWEVVLERPD
jgi:SAM-dependent methyltransferase